MAGQDRGTRADYGMRFCLGAVLVLVVGTARAAADDLALQYTFETSSGSFVDAPVYVASGVHIGGGPGWDPTGVGPEGGPGNGGGAALYCHGFDGSAEAMTLVNFTVEDGATFELTDYHFELRADAGAGPYFNFYIIALDPENTGGALGGLPLERDDQWYGYGASDLGPGNLPLTLEAGRYNFVVSYGVGSAGETGYVALDEFTLLGVITGAPPLPPDGTPCGAGSYLHGLTAGLQAPGTQSGQVAQPYVTENVTAPLPSSDWWTSLMWGFFDADGNAPYSSLLQADPLAAVARPDGLDIGYATVPSLGTEYHYGYHHDLTVGVQGLDAPDARVQDFSDWTVTARWCDGARTMDATLGHGLPFVYCTATGGDAVVQCMAAPVIWAHDGNAVGLTVNGRAYGLFAPSGCTWSGSSTLTCDLAGAGYFSVAVLPEASTTALNLFRQYAYAFVTDTQVAWAYDEATATLTTTFAVTTDAQEGTQTDALLALYRHQWMHTDDALLPYTFGSARGDMALRAGTGFATAMSFNGVLPTLPDRGTYDRQMLYDYVDQVHFAGNAVPPGWDTYWGGKLLGRAAALLPIAEQIGHTAAAEQLLGDLRAALEDWLTYHAGEPDGYFCYEPTWGSLLGYPQAFNTDLELNDHHFHYGYFLMAAAAVAARDPGWAADEEWGGMLRMIIRDATSPARDDPLFPFLRTFDPYAGHSWASGHGAFGAGNNQESASEAMNYAAGVLLLGEALGDTALRDLGIYLYRTELEAIQQYWFDVDQAVFPAGFGHPNIGILWGNGGAYSTWWTAAPEEIHGILFLPVTGASLYLGLRPDYVLTNYGHMVEQLGHAPDHWFDVLWTFLALGDAPAAADEFTAQPDYDVEFGTTRAHTYHWIHNLLALGQVDSRVMADLATYAVFSKEGERSYVAWNAGTRSRRVRSSDGYVLVVPAQTQTTGHCPDPAVLSDFGEFVTAMTGPAVEAAGIGACFDADLDGDVDLRDFAAR